MEYAILGNTYSDGIFLTQGVGLSSKAAKLNKEEKMPAMINNWKNKRPNLMTDTMPKEDNNQSTSSPNNGYDDVLSNLGMELTQFDKNCNVLGFRKLKTAPQVPEKAKKVYTQREKKLSLDNETVVNEEVNIEPQEEVKVALPNFTPDFGAPLSDTRMGRLERTGEIPKVNNEIINTPDRFVPRATNDNNFHENEGVSNTDNSMSRVEKNNVGYSTSQDARNKEETPKEKIELGKSEKDLNRIATINHGSTKSTMKELQEAYDNYEQSEEMKKSTQAELMELERQVAEAKQLLEQKHAEEIADLNAKTQANQEEAMGYTMHSEDLRRQLAELRSQLTEGTTFKR